MNIAIIGAGAMGGAIADGLLSTGLFSAGNLTVSNPSPEKLRPFAEKGAITTTNNQEAVANARWVLLCVKPWLVETVVNEIKPLLNYNSQHIASVAAGISSERLKTWFEKDGQTPTVCLLMPNIAVAQRESMTFMAADPQEHNRVQELKAVFDTLGQAALIEEKQLPAATALASCGIAYAMRYIRAASEGGVELGFKAREAQTFVEQTVKGAVALLQATQMHPEEAIDRVTTPGGITIKGLNEMEHAGFTSAVIKGLKAAR